mgnify:CR=1 FL=1
MVVVPTRRWNPCSSSRADARRIADNYGRYAEQLQAIVGNQSLYRKHRPDAVIGCAYLPAFVVARLSHESTDPH